MGKAGSGSFRSKAQEGVPAHYQVPLVAKLHPGCPPQGHAEGAQAMGQPQGTPGPGGGHRRQPFGEDAAVAAAIAAKPLADAELKAHAVMRPREVGQGALIVTVHALRRSGAQRTGRRRLRRAHPQRDLCRGRVDLTRVEAQRGRIR